MVDARVKRKERVVGDDLQNRWRIQVRLAQHCRYFPERYRARAYLRVLEVIYRRVGRIHKPEVTAKLENRARLFTCKVSICKVVAYPDLVPSERVEEELRKAKEELESRVLKVIASKPLDRCT